MTNEAFTDYDYASKMAWKTLMSLDIQRFPFSLTEVFNKFPRIKLRSYAQYAKELNTENKTNDITPDDVRLMVESDDGATQKLFDGEKYNVLYDGDCSHLSVQRIRFTLAHELGHYVLRHFFNSNTNRFERHSFKEDTNNPNRKAMEKEANRFARELLSPIFMIATVPVHSDAKDISNFFDISPASADNCISYYNSHMNELHLEENSIFANYFSKSSYFIRDNECMPNNHFFPAHKQYFFCRACRALHSKLPYQKCCIFCGAKEMFFIVNATNYLSFHENVEEFAKDMPFVTTSRKDYVPEQCPWCQKFIIDPEERICSNCGSPIRNQCAPVEDLSPSKTWDEILNGPLKNRHAQLLPEYAYFCPICGSDTMYTHLGKLRAAQFKTNTQ